MSRAALSTLAVAIWPAVLGASPYDGIFRQAANAECGLVGVDGAAIEIRDGIFYGVGSQCRMSNPINIQGMDATLYDMQCSGAESQWFERAMVMLSAEDDGIIMLWDGYAFKYLRCPDVSVPKAQ